MAPRTLSTSDVAQIWGRIFASTRFCIFGFSASREMLSWDALIDCRLRMARMVLPGCFAALLFVSLVSLSDAVSDQEGVLRTTVEDAESNDVNWDYSSGPSGPAHWSELAPGWKQCGDAESQSPINIDTGKLKYDLELDVPAVHNYQDAEAQVINTGKFVRVLWSGGDLFVAGKNYTMTHLDFHTPSEHTIDGKSVPLELQMVHESADGDYAMVVVFGDYGPTNWWVEKFWPLIPSLDDTNTAHPVGVLSPSGFQVNFSKYYRYEGSLTYPNCQKGVVWTILSTIYEISEDQITHMLSLLPSPNNRPVQPLGNRKVYYPASSA